MTDRVMRRCPPIPADIRRNTGGHPGQSAKISAALGGWRGAYRPLHPTGGYFESPSAGIAKTQWKRKYPPLVALVVPQGCEAVDDAACAAGLWVLRG